MTSYRDQQGQISVALCKGHCDAHVTMKTCWDSTENFAFRTRTSTVTRIQPFGRKLGQVPCDIWLFAILCWSVWDRWQPVHVGMWLFGDRKSGHPEVEGVAFSTSRKPAGHHKYLQSAVNSKKNKKTVQSPGNHWWNMHDAIVITCA